jgi:Protein of unknown function, DUF255
MIHARLHSARHIVRKAGTAVWLALMILPPVASSENRLAEEKSPYLLQHRDNPVDWYPWGKEAFDRARQENKPVFVSIGYSTCHWCHVMARESFENPQTAIFCTFSAALQNAPATTPQMSRVVESYPNLGKRCLASHHYPERYAKRVQIRTDVHTDTRKLLRTRKFGCPDKCPRR